VLRLADLDAVTFDANGTLIGLVDPIPELAQRLRERGIERPPEAIRRAFQAEGKVYATRSLRAHEPASFAELQRECATVFLDEVGANGLDAADFADTYVNAMRFEVLPDVRETLRRLQQSGLELGVVANFDLTLHGWLERLGLASFFSVVVTPADAGVTKPDPRIFELALERLRVQPERLLHIGDGRVDEEGARAAGVEFAWAPVTAALASSW
jgi:putative hydrolase of the HAD superfamily